MIRVYYLPVSTVDNTAIVSGLDLIHDAILLCTADPLVRKLIMNTTATDHEALISLAESHREPTQAELDLFNSLPPIPPPNPDKLRLQEIVDNPTEAIPQTEVWEAIRILTKLQGIGE